MSQISANKRRPLANMLLAGWSVLTALIAFSFTGIYFIHGAGAFDLIVANPKLSNLTLTISATLIVWLLTGAFITLYYLRRFSRENALLWAGFFLVSMVYVNILRERIEYGDLGSYIQSAASLYENGTLPNGYIYPLLWAGILAIFARYGTDTMFLFAWLLNIAALFAFYFLLAKTLEKYKFTPNLSALVTTVFMLANVPLLRTMIYGQVNLLVLNGILLSLLTYRRSPFISALALTFAVQIKMSPIILVAAILFERNWRWLIWFALHMLILTLAPIMVYGMEPYSDILRNLGTLDPRTFYYFRDTSIDSIFIATASLFKLDLSLARAGIYGSKILLAGGALWTILANIRHGTFYERATAGKFLFNAVPAAMIFLTLASPLVWEHHGIFLCVSFLLLIPRLKHDVDWGLFISAYCFEFILPTFDIYPWSFVRLAAPLIMLALLWVVRERKGSENESLYEMSKWLDLRTI